MLPHLISLSFKIPLDPFGVFKIRISAVTAVLFVSARSHIPLRPPPELQWMQGVRISTAHCEGSRQWWGVQGAGHTPIATWKQEPMPFLWVMCCQIKVDWCWLEDFLIFFLIGLMSQIEPFLDVKPPWFAGQLHAMTNTSFVRLKLEKTCIVAATAYVNVAVVVLCRIEAWFDGIKHRLSFNEWASNLWTTRTGQHQHPQIEIGHGRHGRHGHFKAFNIFQPSGRVDFQLSLSTKFMLKSGRDLRSEAHDGRRGVHSSTLAATGSSQPLQDNQQCEPPSELHHWWFEAQWCYDIYNVIPHSWGVFA